jgi:hypothetical protein
VVLTVNIDAINDLEEGIQTEILFEGRAQTVERVIVETSVEGVEIGAAHARLADGRWVDLLTENWREIRP